MLKNGLKVRYLGLNSPEVQYKDKKSEPFGYKAKIFNEKLVKNKFVYLEFGKKRYGRYGRMLAYVFLKDKRFVNAELIKNGYAYYFYDKKNKKYDNKFLRLQRYAMARKLGIWNKNLKKREKIMGNLNSKIFHLKNCKYAKNAKKKFTSRWKAFWQGYAPHKECVHN